LRQIQLHDDELRAIDLLVGELAGKYETVESAEFQRQRRFFAAELPRRVRGALDEYRSLKRTR